VTKGGNFDVDVSVTTPLNKTIYQVVRQTDGHFGWNADATGDYRFCFSNKFSAITHKVVFFDFRVVDDALDAKPADDADIGYVRTSHFLHSFILRWIIGFSAFAHAT